MERKKEATEATKEEFQMFVLRATRNYHRHEMERMGITLEDDPFSEALNEAIRCMEMVQAFTGRSVQ